MLKIVLPQPLGSLQAACTGVALPVPKTLPFPEVPAQMSSLGLEGTGDKINTYEN
jgi:hypothetical protein